MTYADALARIRTAAPFDLGPGERVAEPATYAAEAEARLADAVTAPLGQAMLRRALDALDTLTPNSHDLLDPA